MQKLAAGHDTDVGSSPPWLRSTCLGAPQAGAAPSWEVAGCAVAAGELAPGLAGADDPLHPLAAPMSRMATQAHSLLIGLVSTVRPSPFRRDARRNHLDPRACYTASAGMWLMRAVRPVSSSRSAGRTVTSSAT